MLGIMIVDNLNNDSNNYSDDDLDSFGYDDESINDTLSLDGDHMPPGVDKLLHNVDTSYAGLETNLSVGRETNLSVGRETYLPAGRETNLPVGRGIKKAETINGKMMNNNTECYIRGRKNGFAGEMMWINIGSIKFKGLMTYKKLAKLIGAGNVAYAYELSSEKEVFVPRLRSIFISHDSYKKLLNAKIARDLC